MKIGFRLPVDSNNFGDVRLLSYHTVPLIWTSPFPMFASLQFYQPPPPVECSNFKVNLSPPRLSPMSPFKALLAFPEKCVFTRRLKWALYSLAPNHTEGLTYASYKLQKTFFGNSNKRTTFGFQGLPRFLRKMLLYLPIDNYCEDSIQAFGRLQNKLMSDFLDLIVGGRRGGVKLQILGKIFLKFI